ncbi:MAG: cysteine desulfurase [Candidatus Daviesbacteria bacterium]|nr:cysteine desulfurase [Candidatus Daviesbacteria bacterium]
MKRIYFDSASTSLKPKQVIDAVVDFYQNYTANIHRGIYRESEEATKRYEEVRNKVAKLINVKSDEIIFTKNTTEAINLVAKTWGEVNIKKGNKILSTIMEHHSNLLPWQELAKRKKAKIVMLDLDLSNIDQLLQGVVLVAITHVSNVLGTINPVAEITKKAHQAGALVLVDGAQAVGHMKVDIKKLGCDFYSFSGHKMLGPSGVGVLWMKKEMAETLSPFLLGGGMVGQDTPQKFEAGTPNIEGVIGLGAAIDYLNNIGIEKIRLHEKALTQYALKKLSGIKGITIYGPKKRAGIISFNITGIHPHDLAGFLDKKGIAIRAGNHCATPLHEKLGIKSSARISFHIYNSKEEIDKLIKCLQQI